MKMVGLIITFALLFFCAMKTWENKESMVAFAKECVQSFATEEVNNEEPKLVEEEIKEPLLDPEKPMVVLSFDDGPSIYTEELLGLLEQNEVRATFFVLGDRVVKYPELVKRMDELKCEIGNHSYNHRKFTSILPEEVQAEIEQTNDAIQNAVGYRASLVRPPYGAVNEIVLANMKYPVALWSVDTTDWQLKDANAVAQHILTTVKDGDVVLMHDIYSSTVEAMRIVIPELKARGYQIVTFSEMMEAHGVEMAAPQKYYNCY